MSSETSCRYNSSGGWPLVFSSSPRSGGNVRGIPQVRNTSTFKHEYHYRHVFATKVKLVVAVDKRMHFENDQRHHSVIGMLSLIAYEHSVNAATQAA